MNQRVIKSISSLVSTQEKFGVPVISHLIETYFQQLLENNSSSKSLNYLFFINLLIEVLPHLAPKQIVSISSLLIKIPRLDRDELTVATYKAFNELFSFETMPIKVTSFTQILKALISSTNQKGDQSLIFYGVCISQGISKLHSLDVNECYNLLPDAFQKVFQLLESQTKNTALSGMSSINKIIRECLDENMIKSTSLKSTTPLNFIISTLKEGLTFKYSENIDLIFLIIAELFKKLHRKSNPLLIELMETIEKLHKKDFKHNKQLERAIGSAIASMGPIQVLKSLPLNLHDIDKRRAWLLPLIRDETSNSLLEYFLKELLPLSKKILKESNDSSGNLAKTLKYFYQQIWLTFPSFCLYATDFPTIFPKLVDEFVQVLNEESDIRGQLCQSFQKVILKNQEIIETKTIPEGIQSSIDLAKNTNKIFINYTQTFIPLLFNLYDQTIDKDNITKLINSFSSISSKEIVNDYFKNVIKKLLQAEQELSDAVSSEEKEERMNRKYTMLDLAISMSESLPNESVDLLYKVVQPYLHENDTTLQKKAYRAISIICSLENHKISHKDIFTELKKALSVCKPSSKKYRNACLISMVEKFDDINEILPQLMVEGILGQKEISSKSRDKGKDLIITLARKFAFGSSDDDEITDEQKEKLNLFIKNFLAGLGGKTETMVSGTIHSLCILLIEFKNFIEPVITDIINSVLLLIQLESKEIIKGVIHFIRTILSILDIQIFEKFLEPVVKGLLYYAFKEEGFSGEIKEQIKFLFQRLIKKFGYEKINEMTQDPKQKNYLKNLNKLIKRKKKKVKKNDKEDQDEIEEEDEDDPLDLLDPTIVTKEKKVKEKEENVQFAEKKGKMLIEEEEIGKKRKRGDEKFVDDFEEQIEEEKEEKDEEKKKKIIKKKKEDNFGDEYKPRKGTGGDIKKTGKPDPYAYIPLDPSQMNKRKRGKDNTFTRFEQSTRKKKDRD